MAKSRIKRSRGERVGSTLVYCMLILLTLITLYPFVYVFSMSVSDPYAVMRQEVWLLPKGFTLDSYEKVFQNKDLWMNYGNTLWYTVVGTLINMVCLVIGAYPLSRKNLFLRRPIMKAITFTMFFSGGMIPTFMVINSLGLYNTRWAMVIPNAVSVWNLIIARTYFEGIPEELIESAKLDGANDLTILGRVVLPLSKSILAVLMLFSAVNHWNAYFNAVLYLPSPEIQPLQIYLQKLLINMSDISGGDNPLGISRSMQVVQMRYSTILVVTLPILCIYPFLQKYFVKGVMIGAIKA